MYLDMGRKTDEPLTPASRLFLTPEMSTIIHCVVAGKLPINIDTAKSAIENSILVKHPRFSSLLITDSHGRGHWRKTHVDIDRHIIVHHDRVGEVTDDQEAINDYLADLSVSSPLDTDKPPWEIHLLMAHKCAVFRLHHALGDGISLMSALLSCCRRADGPDQLPQINSSIITKRNNDNNSIRWSGNIGNRVWRAVMVLWNTAVIVLELMLRSLWKMDKRTVVSGGAGVELWPRKLATAKFRLDDMKTVKTSVAEATINDVLFGVISLGLSRYLDIRSPKAVQEGVQLTGLAMVNLRPQPGLQDLSDLMKTNSKTRWGNQFGILLLPVYYHRYYGGSDPLLYVKRAKAMVDRKKQSLEAYFSHKIGFFVMSLLGSKFAGLLNYRVCCNTTFTFSNVVGPKEEITIAGNPVEYIRVNSTSIPHAITMHMVSYAGRADMQILVAKDIIPDPQVLAKCFEDALLEMKEAAEAALKTIGKCCRLVA